MKLLHTSDWHLGMTFDGLDIRDDQKFFLENIYRIAEEENVDAVLIAGDIYDRANASADAVELYDDAMEQLVLKMKKKVFIIAGNHDSATKLATNNRLLEKTGLYIQGKYDRNATFRELGDCDIYMLPWMSTDRARHEFPERKEEINSLKDAYRIACDEMRKTFREGRRHILVSHSYITGADVSESDRAAIIGNATAVPADVFDGFDYVALGHIHKPQEITDTIRYSGSPMPYSFGKEEKQTKGVVIIDTETMEVKPVALPLLHIRKTVSGTYDEIKNGEYTEEEKNGYIYAVISDIIAGSSVRDELRETLFPNLVLVKGMAIAKTNGNITMTADEYEELENDPEKLFARYCEDTLEIKADESDPAYSSLIKLLREARTEVTEETKDR